MSARQRKRFGRRAAFGTVAGVLITIAFYVVIFYVADLKTGLKIFIAYATAMGILAGVISGFLTATDVKELLLRKNFKDSEEEEQEP